MTSAPACATTKAKTEFDGGATLRQLEESARVRPGAAASTKPDVLQVLAEDSSVMVRAAVAMNRSAPLHIDKLLVSDSDERVRTLLARKMASLLPSVPQVELNTLEAHVFATLAALVEDEAVRVRAAISDMVKEMPHAPRNLILRLAHDNALPVSEPVIRLSPLLTPEDLLALLAESAPPGVAAAMAQRAGLPASVSDRIAATADTQAITALLANRSAAIREATLDALVTRSQNHVEWHEPLVRRPVLSARAARALSDIVATQVLGALASRGDFGEDVTKDLKRRLAERLGGPTTPISQPHQPEPVAAEIEQRARALLSDDDLAEESLLAAVHRGDTKLCCAVLSIGAGVPVASVERAVTLRSVKAVLSLVWKAGFSMRVGGPLQMLLCRAAPTGVLPGRDGGGFPLAVEEMRWQIEFLQRPGR